MLPILLVKENVTSPVPFSGIPAVFEFAPIVPVIFPFALAIDNPLGNEPAEPLNSYLKSYEDVSWDEPETTPLGKLPTIDEVT